MPEPHRKTRRIYDTPGDSHFLTFSTFKRIPQTLMKLMRHESFDTTLRFYVGDDAEKVADEIWSLEN